MQGIRPLKRLGQNFLVSEYVFERELEAAGLSERDTVLEIGPGPGTLTRKLAGRAGRVVAIEKDTRFKQLLDKLPENVEVIYGDALKMEFPRFTKCVSNLPYQISSQFTFKLLEDYSFEFAILSYQKEFAERMMARPGDRNYGRLPAALQFLAEPIEPIMKIGKSCYWPRPKVDSMLVKIVPVKRRPDNWKELSRLINVLFQQPNKTVRSVLRQKKLAVSESLGEKRVRTLTKQDIKAIFDELFKTTPYFVKYLK